MPDEDWWRALWPDPDAIVRALHIASPMTVVDVGCGDGYFTAAIARTAHRGRVIGVDLDPALLEKAKAACAGSTNCESRAGDAMDLGHLLRIGSASGPRRHCQHVSRRPEKDAVVARGDPRDGRTSRLRAGGGGRAPALPLRIGLREGAGRRCRDAVSSARAWRRARCSRLFTASTLIPRTLASGAVSPSTSPQQENLAVSVLETVHGALSA